MWGFWESRHWKPDAALFRPDWSEKPNAKASRDRVFDQWWTGEHATSDQEVNVKLRGLLPGRPPGRRGGRRRPAA